MYSSSSLSAIFSSYGIHRPSPAEWVLVNRGYQENSVLKNKIKRDRDRRTDIQSTDSVSYPWTTDCKQVFNKKVKFSRSQEEIFCQIVTIPCRHNISIQTTPKTKNQLGCLTVIKIFRKITVCVTDRIIITERVSECCGSGCVWARYGSNSILLFLMTFYL